MEQNPLVSVVIPTYNRKDKVLRAIQSVLEQDYENKEIVVVDDGSSDDTSSFLKQKNLPLHIISKPNGGVSSARNAGIKASKGSYIAFLDSDDIWLPEKIKKQVQYLNDNPEKCLVYTDQYLNIDGENLDKSRFERNKPQSKMNLPAFVDYTPIHTSTVMVRKNILDKVGYFDETLSVHEDSELWNRISSVGDFGFIEEVLSIYYWVSNEDHITSTSNRKKFLENGRRYMAIYEKNLGKNITSEQMSGIEKSLSIIETMEKELGK